VIQFVDDHPWLALLIFAIILIAASFYACPTSQF
jgi:hypothetical protein